jgi:CO/xanthine dehydrogenase Mo-binding subunit
MVYRLKTGVKRDGTITAHQVEHFANCGAYAGYKPGGAMGGANQAAGPYRIANVKVESRNVYTNTPPGQILRAPGEPQAIFAIESQIDEVARAIGMDPVAFRMQNLMESGEEMAAGEMLEDVRVKETLQAAADAAGYSTPKPPHVGRGVAVGDRSQGGGPATASITLKPDGRVVVGTPLFDQGTGSHTTLAQVAAEELHVPIDQIEVDVWDTDSVEFDSGTAGSIQSRVSSTVAFQAAEEVKKELIAFVARHLGWPEEGLSVHRDEVWRTDIEERVNWRDLLRDTGTTITGRAHINQFDRGHFTSFAAQVAEVSVDPDTGEVKLLTLTTAHDVGQVLNAIGHQGQINGGAAMGIGFAMMEELRFEDGRVTNVSLGDYKMPTIRDIPELRTVLVRAEKGSGPYNVKGIGELPMVPTAAAVANAIEDAIGVRVRDLPITAEKVYDELKQRD